MALPRAAVTAAAARWRPGVAWRRGGVLSMRELPLPEPPGPGWARVRPLLSGVCGSDMKLLHVLGFSPLLTAFNPAVRAVLGHEVVGVVDSTSPGTTDVHEGDRVIVEPTLRCVHKGLPECARCRAGEGHLCENVDLAGTACPGQGVGFSDRIGGGWADALVMPAGQLIAAAGIEDTRAVVAEPAAVALHAALRWDRAGDRVAVIGPGTIGLLVTAALSRLHPDVDITMLGAPGARRAVAAPAVRSGHERPYPVGTEEAVRKGAARVWCLPPEQVVEQAAALLQSRLLRPRIGRTPVLSSGFDAVFDCVGTTGTVDTAMRMLRGRGTLVMVATAGRQRVDWSMVWWRELSVLGTVVYGRESDGSHTTAQVREWLADPAFAVDDLVTHRFPLDAYREALDTAALGPRAGAIKVALVGVAAGS